MPETLIKSEEFKDSPVGRIPKDWEVVPLSSIGEIVTGATPPSRVMGIWGDVLPFITPGDISEDGQVMKAERNLSASGVKYVRPIPAKTVLVVCIGSTLGKTAFATEECATNQQINAVIPNSIHEPSFIYAVLTYHIDQLLRWAGLQAVPIVNKNQFGKMLVPIAPPDEQRRISEIFDSLDKTIAHTSSLIAKLKLMKAGLLHDLLTRGLDENGELRDAIAHPEQFKDSPLGRIPKDWETPTFEEVTVDDTPICYGIVQPGSHVESGVPVIAIQNLNTDYRTNIHKSAQAIESRYVRSRVCSNDVLLSVKGTIGRVGIVPSWFIGNISRDVARIRLKSLASPQYVRQMLLAPSSQKRLEQAVVGTTRAEVSIGILRKLRLPLPPLPEQELIADVLNVHDTRIRTEEAYRDKLKLQKQGLMHDLLTGKVRVKDADKFTSVGDTV
jgi:type I restriction enzyme S subunit